MHNYHVSMYTELSSLLLAFYVPQTQFASTPLMGACTRNHPQVAGYLISKGASMNYRRKVAKLIFFKIFMVIIAIFFSNRMVTHLSTERVIRVI